jgi:hypothetical protein
MNVTSLVVLFGVASPTSSVQVDDLVGKIKLQQNQELKIDNKQYAYRAAIGPSGLTVCRTGKEDNIHVAFVDEQGDGVAEAAIQGRQFILFNNAQYLEFVQEMMLLLESK